MRDQITINVRLFGNKRLDDIYDVCELRSRRELQIVNLSHHTGSDSIFIYLFLYSKLNNTANTMKKLNRI